MPVILPCLFLLLLGFLLALHILLNFGDSGAMVVGAGIDGFDGVAEDEFVLVRFGGIGIGGIS